MSQGVKIKDNVLLQDNTSAIQLENNGKWSSQKRTKHINVRYFFITDQIEKKAVRVEYCSTDQIVADYLVKPLQGKQFEVPRRLLMNMKPGDGWVKVPWTKKSKMVSKSKPSKYSTPLSVKQ